MIRFAFIEEFDVEFRRVVTNLLRTFIKEGSVKLVSQADCPDFLIAGVWRPHPFPSDIPVVLISNENWANFPPPFPAGLYHAVLGIFPPPLDFGRCSHFIQYPFEAVYHDCPVEQLYEMREELLKSPREKFCCFVTSNDLYGDVVERREEIFREIHAWQHVDSAGANFNNTGYLAPKGLDFLRWISQYRFMICPENSHTEGYITEKALQAWIAGAVPIYDGGSLEGLHSEAFVSASGNYLEEIQALEMNPALYISKQRAELYRERPSLKGFEARFREAFKV
jgi:hypothetical protein